MTRKALRTRPRQQTNLATLSARRGASPWVAVSTLMASTVFATPVNAAALARLSPLQAQRADPAPDQTVRRFDVPSGPIDAVIAAFEAITGVNVTVSTESIRPITSGGVSGPFTTEQALERMLAGTNVTFRFTGRTAVTLELRVADEAVDVVGAAPTTIVSSPKYATPVREISQTVQVISQEIFEEQGARTLSDVLRNVPGISLQAGEGGGASSTSGDMFNMRGFSANNSLFVDGVRDDGLISRDVFNLEQIEVFLGPTGSDVGRGTAAGYVNMNTKAARLTPGYSATYAYGNADQKRFTVDLNRPVAIGKPGSWLSKSAARLNGLWQDGGVPGRQFVENKSQAIAPSLGLGLGTPTRLSLSAQFMRQDNRPDYGVPGGAWLDTALAPTTQLASRAVDQSNYYGSLGYDFDRARQDSYTARVEQDLNSRFTLRNQTRYNRTSREAVITSIANPAAFVASTGLVTLSRQGNERENNILSNQTNLVGRFATGSIQHAVNGSMELSSEDQFAPTLAGFGTRAPVNIFAPNPLDAVTGYSIVRTGAASTGDTNTVAFSAFDNLSLGSRWQVTGGLRWEHYRARFKTVDATGARTVDLTASDNLVSGKAGLLYKWTETGNIYLSFGSTVTPPGTANFTLSAQDNNQNNPNVKPQTSTNLEVGSKWDFFHTRLGFSAAVFRTRNENVIFTVDATAVPPVFNQDDAQKVNGVTLGTSGRITDRWQVLASIAYLDATLESQSAATNGNRLTLTPKYSGNIWTTYQTPFRLSIGGGVRFTDTVFINAANTIEAPSYRIVDGLVEYGVNSHLTLRLNLYNLTDEVYIRNVNNNGGRYNPGNPRSATVTTAFTF